MDRITAQYGFADLVRALPTHRSALIDGAWNSAAALAVAGLLRSASSTILVVLPREKELDTFALDVASFSGTTPLIFPAWELLPQELRMSDPILGSRLRVIKALEGDAPPRVVITTAQASGDARGVRHPRRHRRSVFSGRNRPGPHRAVRRRDRFDPYLRRRNADEGGRPA
ncbi:MAG: hypothetical protein B7Z55_11220 [Planctomycetales bacterium 12-60-4]|nr:MAG: hypothetical protein B7Z55_11220 [Planctomycetales bacterium 12-60-4]